MATRIPALPLDVFRECFQYLESKDLLPCRQVCSLFHRIISDSEELQLRIQLAENGIQPSDMTSCSEKTSISISRELSRLRMDESRHRKVRVGQAYGDKTTFQLTATNLADMHMVGLADDFIFVPLQIPHLSGMRGIHRHRTSGIASPPDLIHFEDDVRHFEVDAAEGVLLVVRQVSAL